MSDAEKKPRDERLLITEYDQAARVTHLYLKQWCDESLPFPAMVADACREVKEAFDAQAAEIERLKAENESLKTMSEPLDGGGFDKTDVTILRLSAEIESLHVTLARYKKALENLKVPLLCHPMDKSGRIHCSNIIDQALNPD